MALLALDMLPMEVLQSISDVLDVSYRPSVASFSCVNRQCRRAATPALFRRLRIQVESPRRLNDDVERWTSTLLVNDSFRSVRKLVVMGDIYFDWKRHSHEQVPDDHGKRYAPFDYEDSWLPLAHFIESLQGLKDLLFQCGTSFPSCLLAVLPICDPFPCRLHISDFSLGSLRQDPSLHFTEPLEIRPRELALITSPHLYSISLSCGGSTSKFSDYNGDAIFEIVARACPALRKVELIHQRAKASPRAKPRNPFPGLKLEQTAGRTLRNSKAKAELTHLSLGGRQPPLEQWQHHTNFDCLQALKLTGNFDAGILEWAAAPALLPSLSCLEMQAPSGDGVSTIRLIQSLSPLKDLTVLGAVNESASSVILEKHGSTLQQLSLPNLSCSIDMVRQLKKACPILERLAITIFRTEGDANEVAIYTELGSHLRIRSLCLNLDCSVDIGDEPALAEPSYDANHRDVIYHTKHVRRTLVNCALDSTLVAEIFHRIAIAKPAGSVPLESVELNVTNAGTIMLQGSPCTSQANAQVYRHFTRRWVCTFNARDDRLDEMLAEERKESQYLRKRYEDIGEQPPILGGVEAAFRAIWSDRTSSDWRDDWKSLPLQG